MKLLMLSDFWPTENNPISGVFVQYQVAEYVRQGNEVCVIAPVPSLRPSRQRDRMIRYAGAEVISPRFPMVPGMLYMPSRLRQMAFVATIRRLAGVIDKAVGQMQWTNEADAVHLNGFAFVGLALPLLKNRPKTPTIVTMHGANPLLECLLNGPEVGCMISASWECVDRIVLCGSTLRSHAERLRAPEQKITQIPNGNDFLMPLHRKEPEGPLTIVTVANLNPRKGVDVHIRAVHRLLEEGVSESIRCRVIGDGPERTRLEKLVKELDLEDCFTFLGRVTHDETLRCLGDAALFCLPSEQEAFPIVFLEAMGAGVPAIGCIGTGAAEIIEDGETGILVPPRDPMALSRSLRTLVEDCDLRRRMSLATRSRADNFTWRRNVEKYVSLFQECGIS